MGSCALFALWLLMSRYFRSLVERVTSALPLSCKPMRSDYALTRAARSPVQSLFRFGVRLVAGR